MSKFKVGDKVRVVRVKTLGAQRWLNNEYTVTKISKNDEMLSWPIYVDGTGAGPFAEDELGLVEQPSFEEQLEQAKQKVAEIEKQIEDAKHKAEKVSIGSLVKISQPYMHPGYMAKVAKDAWVTVSPDGVNSRFDSVSVVRDYAINDWGFEVIREGI
jgi:hypothetical protein